MIAYSVTEITRYIKALIDGDEALCDLAVEGEISNVRRAASGHCYFTLRDAGAELRCVMWRSVADGVTLPEQGERIRAQGYISVYERGGSYQLYVDRLITLGDGYLWQEFLELRDRLEREGLFDEERKQPLPSWPHRVGVVTSPTGAALQDVCNVLSARYPLVEVVVSPSLVQGRSAPETIVRALRALERAGHVDVILVVRGGGSIEDLWAFNDEGVARAVAACSLPVVSGVGHETDFTIIDFVADYRAPTPSAAAAAVVPDAAELAAQVEGMAERAHDAMRGRLGDLRERLAREEHLLAQCSPLRRIAEWSQRVDDAVRRMGVALQHRHGVAKLRAEASVARLIALNPTLVLGRGYAIVRDEVTDRVLRRAGETEVGRDVAVTLSSGELGARVTRVLERGAESDGGQV